MRQEGGSGDRHRPDPRSAPPPESATLGSAMERDWTLYLGAAAGAVLLWLVFRRRRARDSLWLRLLPVAVAVALAMAVALYLKDRL